GLIDMHVHARDFKQEKKENYGSVSLAAIKGGFTSVVCMADTDPVIDNVVGLLNAQAKIEGIGLIKLLQVVAFSSKLEGRFTQDRHHFSDLGRRGTVAFSDDGKCIQDPKVLLQGLSDHHWSYFADPEGTWKPLLLHCEDYRFSPYDKRSEYMYIAMVLKFAEELHCWFHIQHVSCAESVQLIREAKARGAKVTCETAPHYFSLTQRDFNRIGANAKMNPPLRTEKDRQAVIRGLADGTIDAIATDHAPHTVEEKNQPLDKAPFGVIGLETAVPVVFTTLSNRIQLVEIIRKMTSNPAKILGLTGKGTLHPGSAADITVIDPYLRKKVEADKFQSLSRNCPWDGKRLQGWTVMTIVGGRILMKDGELNI
ncbi:MAG: dihydroorotase, partial [Candidatus Parcubacteria bacterium]|nr:dihydroorotase [Candidatus Parcubacteria bacterium]